MSDVTPRLAGALKLENPTEGGALDYAMTRAWPERRPAWRLLRATHAPLILSLPGRFFVSCVPVTVIVANGVVPRERWWA